MNQPKRTHHQRPQATVMSFIGIGIFIVLAIAGIFLLSTLLIWGALIGLVLFTIAYIKVKIKDRFFPPKKKTGPTKLDDHHGRTFDHDEFK